MPAVEKTKMSRKLEDSLNTLSMAVELLEDSAATILARKSHPTKDEKEDKSKMIAPSKQPRKKTAAHHDDFGSLFTPSELNNVKRRLDDAIERLENVLEGADAPA